MVAPATKIPTTDQQGSAGYNGTAGTAGNYFNNFNGTSSATPHVAGLAALILSQNPCLTVVQVNDIIEKTAQKVGGYGYATTGGRPNGTWDDEMGYGLIDVDAALRMTRELYLQNVTITGTETHQVHGTIQAGYNVNPAATPGNVDINSGATVEFHAATRIVLAPGFRAHAGADFHAKIISTSCADWNSSARLSAPEQAAAAALPAGLSSAVIGANAAGLGCVAFPNS